MTDFVHKSFFIDKIIEYALKCVEYTHRMNATKRLLRNVDVMAKLFDMKCSTLGPCRTDEYLQMEKGATRTSTKKHEQQHNWNDIFMEGEGKAGRAGM